MLRSVSYALVLLFAVTTLGVQAADDDKQSRAELAVANILFDYDFGSEFASYRVDERGFVDLIMASNTPDEIYSEILTRMQNHPDIDDVLASKSGPACSVSNWKR